MTVATVLLTLANIGSFTRADLKDVSGIPVTVAKGETIRVTEDIADQLLGDDYMHVSGGEDGDQFEDRRYFHVAAEGTKVAYDFTADQTKAKEAIAAGAVATHDLSELPEEVPLTQAEQPKAKHGQRNPRSIPRAKQ
jgi:hypothetical protein